MGVGVCVCHCVCAGCVGGSVFVLGGGGVCVCMGVWEYGGVGDLNVWRECVCFGVCVCVCVWLGELTVPTCP